MKNFFTKNNITLYLTIIVSLLLAGDTLEGQLSFGIYVGAVYSGNIWLVSLLYLANSILSGWGNVVVCAIHVAVVVLMVFICRVARRKIGKWVLLLCCLLSNVYYCINNADQLSMLLDSLVYVAIGIAFSYVCLYVYRAVFVRGLVYRPAWDELLCISTYYLVMCYCMSSISFAVYMPIMLVAPITILLVGYIFGNNLSVIAGILSGLGALLATHHYPWLVLYVVMGLVVMVLGRAGKVVTALGLVVTDIIVCYFTQVHSTFDIYVLMPTALSALCYIALPNRALCGVKDLFCAHSQHASRSIVNKLRSGMAGRLYRLADVFLAMRNTFVAMVGQGIDKNDAKISLVNSTRDKVCADCTHRTQCWRDNIALTESNMFKLCDCAMERGSATILDIPPQLTTGCSRLSSLLSYINSQSLAYSQHVRTKHNSDNSKLLIGQQLGGVSQLFGKLAQDMRGGVTFHSGKEQEIMSQLIFHSILTSEVVFIEQSGNILIILTIAKNDLDHVAICSVVGSVVKKNLYIDRVESSASPSWVAVYLAVQPQYHITYGLRNIAKHGSEISGDTHAFNTIDGGKCLLSICDGMGSGREAEQVSSTAITLVENFYKAGFDNDIILSCVNQLMATYNSEVYTAVDICVIDLHNGLCDFIKMGSSHGLVKCGSEVSIVSGNSLPLGAVDKVLTPTITKKALHSGDLVLLASDGVWDCYGDDNAVADIVATSIMTNPQTLADEVMDRAMTLCKGRPSDDMTVLVARLV